MNGKRGPTQVTEAREISLPMGSLLDLKIHGLRAGLKLTPAAEDVLSQGGTQPLTVHEYATTGGVTLRAGDLYLNAPFDEWFSEQAEAVLDVGPGHQMVLTFRGEEFPCEVLPLPAYLNARNSFGQPVTATVMSHCDRIRVSPLSGCVLDCKFCDVPGEKYMRHSVEEILASVEVAKTDPGLPPRHLLISGGSPGPNHFDWFDDMIVGIVQGCGLPTDVMMSPREGDLHYLDRYVDAGVQGFSLNLEVWGEAAASTIMPRKHRNSTPHFVRTVERCVGLLGAGTGLVRSIVIVGLDDFDTTLDAIRLIASLGADPVLSPFRPAVGTQLSHWKPPSGDFLRDVYLAAVDIAAEHDVELGPRCIPCMHNTLTLPTREVSLAL